MQVFKCAMRIIRGNIVFPLIYIVGLSFMGIFMVQSLAFDGVEAALDQKSVSYSVVDRDASVLSESVGEFLEGRGIPVEIEDSDIAFQDAVAKGQTDYLLIIPEGYEEDFYEAVASGEKLPQMQVVYSFYSADGALMDEAVEAYLGMVRTVLLEDDTISTSDAVSRALELANVRSSVSILDVEQGMSAADRFVFYMQWSIYTLFAGIVVCVGMLISTMNRADVRRRNLSSPMSYASYNFQLALSCGVLALAACLWTYLLGLIAFPDAAIALAGEGLALCFLSMLAYAFMALAFGFMLGQFGVSALICNAFGNIFGMVISFMGGAWISLDLMSPEILALSKWLPGYWYTQACQLSSLASSNGGANIGELFADIGVLLIFAAAFLCVGFVAAKKRLQTNEAGGNRAAESKAML